MDIFETITSIPAFSFDQPHEFRVGRKWRKGRSRGLEIFPRMNVVKFSPRRTEHERLLCDYRFHSSEQQLL
jgi:hypothetical protein